MKNLQELNVNELQEFFNSFDDVLLDNDGVVTIASVPIKGVQYSIRSLKKCGKSVTLTTNNCMMTFKEFGELFKESEIDLEPKDVLNPTRGVINYLKSINFQKKVFIMGMDALKSEIKLAGFDVYDFDYNENIKDLPQVINAIKDVPDVGAIISDVDPNLTYIKLLQACHIANQKDVLIMHCATDKSAPLAPNMKALGSHYFQKCIEDYTGKEAMVFGKPGSHFNEFLMNKLKIDPARTLFIGDSIVDLEFARTYNYKMLLALTGSISHEKMNNLPGEYKPKFYIPSLTDLHELINNSGIHINK